MLIHHFEAETQGFQGLVESLTPRKITFSERNFFLRGFQREESGRIKATSIISLMKLMNWPKTAKITYFGGFGGTKNGTSGARIKILRPLFNRNTKLAKNSQNDLFGRFGGYQNWYFGCLNQNSKTTFQ